MEIDFVPQPDWFWEDWDKPPEVEEVYDGDIQNEAKEAIEEIGCKFDVVEVMQTEAATSYIVKFWYVTPRGEKAFSIFVPWFDQLDIKARAQRRIDAYIGDHAAQMRDWLFVGTKTDKADLEQKLEE